MSGHSNDIENCSYRNNFIVEGKKVFILRKIKFEDPLERDDQVELCRMAHDHFGVWERVRECGKVKRERVRERIRFCLSLGRK